VLLWGGCATEGGGSSVDAAVTKIGFDLAMIDDEGLIGEGDGRRALSYELCIPDRPDTIAEVLAIDPSARAQGSAPGRIGCAEDEVLVVGETHQPDFRSILLELASRDDVSRIEQAFFE
jgi:hypothetical protein